MKIDRNLKTTFLIVIFLFIFLVNNYETSKERMFKASHENFDINSNDETITSEEMNVIRSMWEDLGVTEGYRIIYENIVKDIDKRMRKDFLDFETTNLKKFSDNLLVLIFIYILEII